MKLFQLYPKALAHLTCKSPRPAMLSGGNWDRKDARGDLRRPGERRTERAGPKGQTFHGHGEQNARQARDR